MLERLNKSAWNRACQVDKGGVVYCFFFFFFGSTPHPLVDTTGHTQLEACARSIILFIFVSICLHAPTYSRARFSHAQACMRKCVHTHAHARGARTNKQTKNTHMRTPLCIFRCFPPFSLKISASILSLSLSLSLPCCGFLFLHVGLFRSSRGGGHLLFLPFVFGLFSDIGTRGQVRAISGVLTISYLPSTSLLPVISNLTERTSHRAESARTQNPNSDRYMRAGVRTGARPSCSTTTVINFTDHQ